MARILVVDDDHALRGAIARYLRTLGHHVDEAPDGRHAIAAIRESAVDLVLTDVNMPDMDGIEVLKAVKDHDRDVPVIVISGGGVIPSQILLGNAHLLGAYATLDKPFDLDELRAAVESALA